MSTSPKTILHADDERSWRDYVHALLSDKYNVVFAEDFESTLARLRSGGVDLLILDHLMPGTAPLDDAAAVCAFLRRRHPKLPVVVLSGALVDSPMTNAEFERMVGAPLIRKEDVESQRSEFLARVDKLLS